MLLSTHHKVPLISELEHLTGWMVTSHVAQSQLVSNSDGVVAPPRLPLCFLCLYSLYEQPPSGKIKVISL